MSRSIAEVERDRAQAIKLARSVAGQEARIEFPEATRSYAGQVVAARNGYVIQEHAGSGAVVVHERAALSPPPRQDLTGKAVEIRYPHGNRAGLLREDLNNLDHDLTRFERAARDDHRAVLNRDARPDDEKTMAALEARANAFAEARTLHGKLNSMVATNLELSRFERAAKQEAEYAVRQGDERHAAVMNARAGAFSEARVAFVEGWEHDIAAAERGFLPAAGRDGRETTDRDDPQAAEREDRQVRAEPQAPELER